MFRAQTVLATTKLRQERHGSEHRAHHRGHGQRSKHAAPDGAWFALRGSSAIDTALLTELSRTPTQRKTSKYRKRR
jgi:hypothetical protein